LVEEAKAVEGAGAFAVVLEGVPDTVARMVTESLSIPTIGIGAGSRCDGQVLVFHDLLGLQDRLAPKFVRRYAALAAEGVQALQAYAADVRSGAFPGPDESYTLADDVAEVLGLYAGLNE
jgi:3-methyl-2-oxobutanoate hydroxymethyltransferase